MPPRHWRSAPDLQIALSGLISSPTLLQCLLPHFHMPPPLSQASSPFTSHSPISSPFTCYLSKLALHTFHRPPPHGLGPSSLSPLFHTQPLAYLAKPWQGSHHPWHRLPQISLATLANPHVYIRRPLRASLSPESESFDPLSCPLPCPAPALLLPSPSCSGLWFSYHCA